MVTIPGFSTPATSPSDKRNPNEERHPTSITIVATARSGGALNPTIPHSVKGTKVYTIYLDTPAGMATLQFAERAAEGSVFQADLDAPEPIELKLPDDVKRPKLLISCILDKTGTLKDIRILPPDHSPAAAFSRPAQSAFVAETGTPSVTINLGNGEKVQNQNKEEPAASAENTKPSAEKAHSSKKDSAHAGPAKKDADSSPANSKADPKKDDPQTRMLAAIKQWKFRPAMKANEPVEVDAILGFGVDTR
jgi:hypothetical protein